MEVTDLVSVIIPIYNGERFLEKAVNSVLNQTYKNIEVILVNDGSIDNSRAICDLFAKKDGKIKVIHQENAGVSIARNNAMDIARGEFIQFVDCDDYIEKDMVKTLIKEINKNNDIVLCGFNRIYKDKNNRVKKVNSSSYNEPNLTKIEFIESFGIYFKGFFINYISNKLYRRKIIKENNLSFNNKIERVEDLVFNLDYLDCCNKISIIEGFFYNYVNYNEDSITSGFNKNLYSSQQIMYNYVRRFLIKNDSYYGKNKEIVEIKYTDSIIGTIDNLFHINSTYSPKEIKLEINNIVKNNIVIKNISYFNKVGLQKRIVGKMVENKNINLIFYYFKIKNYAKIKMKWFYEFLRKLNSYTK